MRYVISILLVILSCTDYTGPDIKESIEKGEYEEVFKYRRRPSN